MLQRAKQAACPNGVAHGAPAADDPHGLGLEVATFALG